MSHPVIYLNKQSDRRLKKGHPWIYSNEVDVQRSPLKTLEPGSLAAVHSASGQFLATAIINPHVLICGRVISRDQDAALDVAFFTTRIRQALALREQCFLQPYYRLVYGDSDFLPGVVIDRFNEHVVVQLTTSGMDRVQDVLLDAVEQVLSPKGVVMLNNHAGRELEGLEDDVRIIGQIPEFLKVVENNTLFEFSAAGGQKTGWFYDHRPNRAVLQQLAPGKRVLDVFSYVGGWGIQAAKAGAESVVCVDASEAAMELVGHNASLNDCLERVSGVRGKAIDALKQLLSEGEKFDIVVLDPPAFIKRRKDQKAGEAAYRHINELGVRLLARDGILVSASCSMPLTDEALTAIVHGAARQHDRRVQQFHAGGQGMDHPVHPLIPETRYIKAQFYRVLQG